MSECMTIADETIEQKDTCTEITPKTIVDFILEEALLSAFVNSDKGFCQAQKRQQLPDKQLALGCSRIGDFNIADDFHQQDQLPHPKDFEQIDHSLRESTATQESNLNSGENVDRPARESLGLLIDSFVRREDKFKPAGECTVITEEILANNELQIKNGQIHLEKNGTEESEPKTERSGHRIKEDTVKDGKIEIEYFNEGKLNKIYVPLNPLNGSEVGASAVDRRGLESEEPQRKRRQDRSEEVRSEDPERPFKPFTTEELRQVWGNGNSSLVGKWDGDALAQREEAVRLMEELSSVHVFPDSSADPNRPRACAFAEEDVKKIIKEIEEISFTQCHANSEDSDVAYHPDGQGDADLEVKSSSKSKDNIKSMKSTGPEADSKSSFTTAVDMDSLTTSAANGPSCNDKHHLRCEATHEERLLNSSFCNVGDPLERRPPILDVNFSSSSLTMSSKELEESASGAFPSESADLNQFLNGISEENDRNACEDFYSESASLYGNKENLSGSKIDEFRLQNLEFTSELDGHAYQGIPSDAARGSQNSSNSQDSLRQFRNDIQQDAISPSGKSVNNAEGPIEDAEEKSASSTTDVGAASVSESRLTEGSDDKQFELRSQKMYLGANYELAGGSPNDFNLSESEEAFIDLMESVIQIIDPPEGGVEEDASQISFSLLAETPSRKPAPNGAEVEIELPVEKNISSDDVEHLTKRVYSGMTTIGPMKNVDHDPKDLTAPDVDYGKMTRITSSRQLAKDFGLFSTEATTIKILEEDDSDDRASENAEEDHAERTSLVNRDIASLTKVQKIREVMSYQPKAEEDFEDDEVLARPRLDLKDVESMTDERYKVPDVNIPLLSFEIGETDLNPEKELIDGMGLVISGLTNPTYYEEEIEDGGRNQRIPEKFPPVTECDEPSDINLANRQRSESKDGEIPEVNPEKDKSQDDMDERISVDDPQQDAALKNQKYGTLGSVFKKASSKFLRKEGDLFMRNSKSLPRDATRISASDSIRSMIDDCQSSASNVLKKSRSLLKNTQGVFKSISQSRMSSDVRQKKPFSPSESDVTAIERKFSGFLKKEDFTKAKNLIKEKVEKAFKNFETGSSPEPETVPEKRDLRVVVKTTENLQVERIENFKKILPKTPLVYKSQFVKSQMNVQSNPQESAGVVSSVGADEEQKTPQKNLNSTAEDVGEKTSFEETEIQEHSDPERPDYFQEKLQWINSKEDLKSLTNDAFEPDQPEFIVMETVQGLVSTDLDSPSSEKENVNVDNTGKPEKGGPDPKKTEASNSFQALSDGGRDVTPRFPETDEDKIQTKSPERKTKTKKKKFTARFRSFWCSAFGRVKTSPGKGDLS